jgi:hypothetical protein
MFWCKGRFTGQSVLWFLSEKLFTDIISIDLSVIWTTIIKWMRNMNVMSVCLSVFILYFRNSRDFGETDNLLYTATEFLKNGSAYKTLLHTTSLTPCKETLFQKLIVPQLLVKFPAFYCSRKSITACIMFIPIRFIWINSTPSHCISVISF